MNQLLVFARAPRPGEVKRRLAASIGEEKALAFYRASLFDLLARLGGNPRWRWRLVVTPDEAVTDDALWPEGIERTAQGGGDLGLRMRRALETAPPGPVALIGSDVPGIEAEHVASAFAALEWHDFVLGPSPDGGFWLVAAARRQPLPETFLRQVRWSSPCALADTLASLPRDVTFTLVDELEDVDDAATYDRWQRRMAR